MRTTTITTIMLPPITEKQRKFQKAVLTKYRGSTGFVPSLQSISLDSGTSVGAAAQFVNGNSSNGKIRELLKLRAIKNLTPLPADVKELLEIWDTTKATS